MSRFFRRSALAGLVVLIASAAGAVNNPIPGIDIIVRKEPGGTAMVVATTDASGKFSARLREPGNYTLSTSCQSKDACGTYKVSIKATGASMKAGRNMTATFTVGTSGPVVVSGQIAEANNILMDVSTTR